MSEPTTPVPASVSGANDWLTSVPGGDIPFDDLFGSPSGEPTPNPAPPASPAAAPPQEPVTAPPSTPDSFLKAGSSVYKTKEEAERGLEYKDQVIERLRQTEIQRTGIDPLTGKAMPPPSQGPVSYRNNQKAYFDDLYSAVTKNDPAKYYEAQQKMIFDSLEPIQPIISEFTKNQAIQNASNEIKDLPNFLRSDDYTKTLDEVPELRDAIKLAETDLTYASRLSQFYKTAYWVAQGRKTPELVQNAAAAAAVQHPNQPTARPTTAPTTMQPPVPGVPANLTTSEGRKAIMEQLGAKLADTRW